MLFENIGIKSLAFTNNMKHKQENVEEEEEEAETHAKGGKDGKMRGKKY